LSSLKLPSPPKLTNITAEKGVPSPMLATTSLSLDNLQKCIDTFSSHLAKDNPKAEPDLSTPVQKLTYLSLDSS
jgi:hypothetical protein